MAFLSLFYWIFYRFYFTLKKKMFSCQKVHGLTRTDDVPTDLSAICQKMVGMKNCLLDVNHQNKPHTNVKRNAGISPFFTDEKCGMKNMLIRTQSPICFYGIQKKLFFSALSFGSWKFISYNDKQFTVRSEGTRNFSAQFSWFASSKSSWCYIESTKIDSSYRHRIRRG